MKRKTLREILEITEYTEEELLSMEFKMPLRFLEANNALIEGSLARIEKQIMNTVEFIVDYIDYLPKTVTATKGNQYQVHYLLVKNGYFKNVRFDYEKNGSRTHRMDYSLNDYLFLQSIQRDLLRNPAVLKLVEERSELMSKIDEWEEDSLREG